MNIPFTTEQFFNVFREYNTTVFPVQVVLNLLALAAIYFSVKKKKYTDLFISYTLGFLWLWVGIVYHLLFFSEINPAANIFAIFFALQGLIFIYLGAVKDRLNFKFRKDFFGTAGLVFIIYALLIYPVLGILFGHTYPDNPTFGLPCPTTIFTFGILLWTIKKVPLYFIVIPLLWSLLGISAAVNFSIYEDFGLIIAGVTGFILVLISNKNLNVSS